MLLLLIHFLQEIGEVHVPSVFSYFSTRMILASLTSVALTIFLGPSFIRRLYALRIGQPIRSKEECPLLYELHEKKKDTPTMGGILMLFSMIISLLLFMDLTHIFTWILLLGTLFLGAVGSFDDYMKLKKKNTKGISPRKKMLSQILFSCALGVYLLYPPFTDWISQKTLLKAPLAKEYIRNKKASPQLVQLTTQEYMKKVYFPFKKKPLFYFQGFRLLLIFLLIVVVITGASNAVNLTDGLDGLAAGCLIMTSFVLGMIAFLSNHIEICKYLNILYIEGSGEIAIYLTAMAGACLGFLWYNGYPAQVFMGDTGSLTLGGVLGISAILLRREVLLALVGGIFVVEAVSVILQVISYRYRNRKRVFLCAPLHHHFEYKGWPETKVVLRFWIIALFLAILGIASLKFQ